MVVGGGGCLDPSPAPHLYITNHLTSFKTIICSRVGGGRGW